MSLQLTRDPLLSEHTTLRLGGPALALAVARSAEDLDELGRLLPGLGGQPFALGAGSNLLAADSPHALVLVHAANRAAQIKVSPDGTPLVRAGAGLGLPRLLGLCQREGLAGLEGLTGVPGRVGGSVAMNAGSYGVELSARLTRLRLWTRKDGLFWREAKDCGFGYRHFDPKLPADAGFWLVWEVELALDLDEPGAVRARMATAYARKKATQPVTAKSAGCVFKNPEGQSAGKLLDEAGLRGRRLGGMAFSSVHANFLVNLDNGTAAEALELLECGRAAVLDRFGVNLQTEVKVLP